MQADLTDTEQAIFTAALEIFARKGRDGARMQEIADAAGINKAMLHYYFRSKDKLYEAVFGHAFLRYCAAVSAEVPEDEPVGRTVERFVSRYIEFLSAEPDVMRLFVHENLSGGQTLGRHLTEVRSGDGPALLPTVLQKRLSRDAGPSHDFLTVLSACVFPFIIQPTVFAMFPEAAADPEAFHKERIRAVTQVLLCGVEAHT